MVSALRGRVGKKDPKEVMAVIGEHLFGELGFQYEEGLEKGSCLSFTLREKKGNSLGLSTPYLALAERLGLPLFGAYMPEHFLVRYDGGRNVFYIEPGDWGKLHPEEYCQGNFPIPKGNGFYLRNLGKKEVIGLILHKRGFSTPEGDAPKKPWPITVKPSNSRPGLWKPTSTGGLPITSWNVTRKPLPTLRKPSSITLSTPMRITPWLWLTIRSINPRTFSRSTGNLWNMPHRGTKKW